MLHDVGRGTLVHEFVVHVVHVGRYVAEEALIAFAEVIEARFAVGGGEETVLGAAAVAGKEPFAFTALTGQRLTLGLTEGMLTLAVHHGGDGFVMDVT